MSDPVFPQEDGKGWLFYWRENQLKLPIVL